ncbi:SDR family NAD(P)-dependent oxidoreductase [Ahrensia kielensis]|uniref:SDR family NAD(P)-dependent oxidoreductase n=1 Tax=Ahrensia kielensis TaxID=76980 RepID=UPI00036B8D77|nr:SDR family NAD(P)-dependent oxidoreductase [Ahrensia kielensis]
MTQTLSEAAVVFGAGSRGGREGIGRAIALELARRGKNVLCIDASLDNARETADAIIQEGFSGRAAQADVTDANAVKAAVDAFATEAGPITIGVFNVGIQTMGDIEDLTPEALNSTMQANLGGAVGCTQALLPGMKKEERGSIVFISSIASIVSSATPNVAYGTSKAALNLFSRSLAVSHAKYGIRSNVVMPGLIDSPMVRSAFADDPAGVEEVMKRRSQRCPSGRMGTAQEVAKVAAFLASDDASYVSGALLSVDGALSCKMA